jgi:hypothetical protein
MLFESFSAAQSTLLWSVFGVAFLMGAIALAASAITFRKNMKWFGWFLNIALIALGLTGFAAAIIDFMTYY